MRCTWIRIAKYKDYALLIVRDGGEQSPQMNYTCNLKRKQANKTEWQIYKKMK